MRLTGLSMFLAGVLVVAPALAQSPWKITVNPTMNPLPKGFCGAVRIDVRDAAGTDIPRNPLGARISLADFDMTVAAPGTRTVVGQQIDASHWSICACNAALVGSTGTVTATYPAKALPAAARIPGFSQQATATFNIAASRGGTSVSACSGRAAEASPPHQTSTAPTATRASTTAPSTGPIASTPTAAPASGSQAEAPSSARPPGANRPTSPPATDTSLPSGVPASVPGLPRSPAEWAALQHSLGGSGWADLQKSVDEFENESAAQALADAEEKPPPGAFDPSGVGRNHPAAVAAFRRMLPVLRHPRCVNCHTRITYRDQSKADGHGYDGPDTKATHLGGDIDDGSRDSEGRTNFNLIPCRDCHTKAPPPGADEQWAEGPQWTTSSGQYDEVPMTDYQLCVKMKLSRFRGEHFLDHLRESPLIGLGFEGRRGMADLTPKPPPLSRAQFVAEAQDWINHMDAMKEFPKSRSEGCPRAEGWSGAIEYTYSETSPLNKFESHGIVQITEGHVRWSGLAARVEDHGAAGCPSIYSASASGGGMSQLVTVDSSNEAQVTGLTAAEMKGGQVQSPNVLLTVMAKKYAFSVEIPLKGFGKYAGGGPACPGYKPYRDEFDVSISDAAGGKFDQDNPDHLTGSRSTSPHPGALLTLKWTFTRLNREW